MLLSAENVSKTFGSLRAVAGADLSIDEGEIIGSYCCSRPKLCHSEQSRGTSPLRNTSRK